VTDRPATGDLAAAERLFDLHAAESISDVQRALARAACDFTASPRGIAGLSSATGVAADGWHDATTGWHALQLDWRPGEGAPGHVTQGGSPIVCNAPPCTAAGLAGALGALGAPAPARFACAPLTTAGGATIGFVEVGDKSQPYASADLAALALLGRHAALRLSVLARQAADAARLREQDAFCAIQTEIARKLQHLLLPTSAPQVDGVELGILYVSASTGATIGGDFVDLCSFSPGLLSAAIGDVSGKGVEATAVTVMAKYALRATLAAHWPPRPGDVLAEVNNALSLQVEDTRFVTLGLGLLDTRRETFSFASAGHPAPWVLRGHDVERLQMPAQPAIAVQPTFEGSPYPTQIVSLAPGDAVLLFTDGVADARNAAGHFYEESRMADVLADIGRLPAQQLVESLYADACSFAGVGAQTGGLGDDVALVCLRLL
jgi:phosphoserine phosphatase RsbU/P